MIAVRRSAKVFGNGSIEFLYPANHRILAYVRRFENETVLVVNNLSSAAQAVELDLRRFQGKHPDRDVWQEYFSAGGRTALSANLGPLSVLLVSAETSLNGNAEVRLRKQW